MQRPDSLKKTLMLGNMEENRRRGMKCLHCITSSVGMNLSKLQETVINRGAWHATVNEAATWNNYSFNACILNAVSSSTTL